MSANPITPAFKLPAFLLALGLLVSTGGCRIASEQEGFVEPDPPVELNIWLIPGSGLEPLIGQYQALHPELDIHIQISTFTQLPSSCRLHLLRATAPRILLLLISATWISLSNFPNISMI